MQSSIAQSRHCLRGPTALGIWFEVFLLALMSLSIVGCRPSAEKEVVESQQNSLAEEKERANAGASWFEDVTDDLEINFVNSPGQAKDYFMPASVGGGVAVIDVNRDGLMDLYFLRMASPESDEANQLYVQESAGQFVDRSREFGLDVSGLFHGVGAGDLNNDGYTDLVLTEYLGIRILINLKGKGFVDITEIAGVENPAWGMSVSLVDYDVDGWLDIVVANYVKYDPSRKCRGSNGEPEFCGPQTFLGSTSRLLRNRGVNSEENHVSFEDVTLEVGLTASLGPGLGVVCLDLTGNGSVDFLFADDMEPNRLFVNQGDGTFKDEAALRGIAVDGMGQARADMGIGVGDINRDGLLDIFITHTEDENHTLWQQGPRGLYSDKTLFVGLAERRWRGTAFGTVLSDFDNDGWADLAMVNGSIRRSDREELEENTNVDAFWRPYVQRSQMYRNTGEGRFEEISLQNPDFSGLGEVGRGLLAADLDNDGGIDLVSSPIGSRARVFRNKGSGRGAWLGISAVLPEYGGRYAYGAIIEITANGNVFRSVVNSGYSYLCSNDPRVLVGLGEVAAYERVAVTWPDQVKEFFDGGEVNQFVRLEKGAGTPLNKNGY